MEIQVADEYVGAVMGDLSVAARPGVRLRARRDGRTVIRAEVPEVEIGRYAIELRSLSHGTGTFTRNYLRHEPMPPQLATKVTDPYVGRISLVRVFSGTLRPDLPVHVSGHGQEARGHADHDIDERVGVLSSPLGKVQRGIDAGIAGDIVAVAKLLHAESGDTLSGKDDPMLIEQWLMPDPLLPVAIRAHAKSDEDKLSQSLSRLVAEDATLRLEMNPETRQLVLWCMGEAHMDLVLDRLKNKFGVAVDTVSHRISLRETFGGAAKGHGRHVKQSGGHGQYAICDIEVTPLPSGSGFEFVDKVVGGAVPRNFIPSVEKGVRAQMERGVAAGYPVIDLRVTLYDGKAHSVDSSDMAFQTAGALALKDAAAKTSILLLEPVDSLEIQVADEYVGAIMGDLSVAARPGLRLRARRERPHGDPRRRPRGGDRALRDRAALTVARDRDVHAQLPGARADAAAAGDEDEGGGRAGGVGLLRRPGARAFLPHGGFSEHRRARLRPRWTLQRGLLIRPQPETLPRAAGGSAQAAVPPGIRCRLFAIRRYTPAAIQRTGGVRSTHPAAA